MMYFYVFWCYFWTLFFSLAKDFGSLDRIWVRECRKCFKFTIVKVTLIYSNKNKRQKYCPQFTVSKIPHHLIYFFLILLWSPNFSDHQLEYFFLLHETRKFKIQFLRTLFLFVCLIELTTIQGCCKACSAVIRSSGFFLRSLDTKSLTESLTLASSQSYCALEIFSYVTLGLESENGNVPVKLKTNWMNKYLDHQKMKTYRINVTTPTLQRSQASLYPFPVKTSGAVYSSDPTLESKIFWLIWRDSPKSAI